MINNSLNSFRRAGLYLTCASVMVIELLCTRMIAHFYGISLYVWASLISITMIALALGYFVGCLWTDSAKRTGLSLIIALAALFTHLLTVETLTQLRGLLSSHGILALNFVGFANDKNAALPSVSRTIEQVFPSQSVSIAESGDDYNDFIFLAASQPIKITSKSLLPDQVTWLQNRVFYREQKSRLSSYG